MGYLIEYQDFDWYTCLLNTAQFISYDVNSICVTTTESVTTMQMQTTELVSTIITTTTTTTTTTAAATLSSGSNNTQIFVAPTCSNGAFGSQCNISSDLCSLSQPCLNLATCFPNFSVPNGYTCSCSIGFSGLNCEVDIRICRPNVGCLYGGICNGTTCVCPAGKSGQHCQSEVDSCTGIKCENNGQCVSSYGNWTCHCIDSELYSGTYCEIKSSKLRTKEIVSRSFACVAIGSIATVIGFLLVMDALKYIFHINPIDRKLDSSKKHDKRREKKKKTRQPKLPTVAIRLQYVHA